MYCANYQRLQKWRFYLKHYIFHNCPKSSHKSVPLFWWENVLPRLFNNRSCTLLKTLHWLFQCFKWQVQTVVLKTWSHFKILTRIIDSSDQWLPQLWNFNWQKSVPSTKITLTCFVRGSITERRTDFQFYLFTFSCFAYVKLTTTLLFLVES